MSFVKFISLQKHSYEVENDDFEMEREKYCGIVTIFLKPGKSLADKRLSNTFVSFSFSVLTP